MRTFEIYDSSKRGRMPVARLVYDEAESEMRIAISEDARPDGLPVMLALSAERGQRDIPDAWARKWVEERIPPRGRQNLGEILRAQGLDRYDEIALLASSEGRSAQDDFLIREVRAPHVEYAAVELGGNGAQARDAADSPTPSRAWCAQLGPRIAEKRRALGMTQQQLAEATGVAQAAISRIESGRANPTINTLEALVEGVNANLRILID